MADTDEIMPDDLGLPVQAVAASGVAPDSGSVGMSPGTEAENLNFSGAGSSIAFAVGPLSESPLAVAEVNGSGGGATTADAVDMRSIEREHILQVLRNVNGSRRRAVELLGISERALRYKLKNYREEGHLVS
jgi:two-component system response regulator FlrC